MEQGKLYIVSTPIGNLEDITLRAIRILKEVSIIAAEDTRHTQKLLNHYQIATHQTSYHDHNKEEKAEILISKIKEGRGAALVCDAGTPGISDPGYYLIKRAIEEAIQIVPIPGASAVIAGLSVSGLPTDRFVFEGFLPKGKARHKYLKTLEKEERTIILYESPHRFIKTLRDIQDALGNRRIVVGRELTKLHEEIARGKAADLINAFDGKKIRGEITIIIEGAKKEAEEVHDIKKTIGEIIRTENVSRSEAARIAAKRLGISKKEAYKERLKIRGLGE
ncbi:MAG: 16S rRNA (cytidine(1402)-2'-O)-methyltransferase [Nitrospirae bacterium]|nr:16S rRNA (cytidine(1402)-2'-O)-methyltransferase [Nitrospirota bacterium]